VGGKTFETFLIFQKFLSGCNFVYMQNALKDEIRAIISGKSQVRHGTTIQAASSYLGNGKTTSPKSQVTKQIREQETRILEQFITKSNLWVQDINFSNYISQGAEQRVFLRDSDQLIFLLPKKFQHFFAVKYLSFYANSYPHPARYPCQ